MKRRTVAFACRLAAVGPLSGLALSGCATRAPAPSRPSARCDFATCGVDAASLVKVTADAVGTAPAGVAVLEAQQQFNGAVLIWRATAGGRAYECKEGRDPATRTVHYVDCQPSSDKGAMKAFP